LLAVGGCQRIEEQHAFGAGGLGVPAVAHPAVERDLDHIRATGVIRMITRYNSSSYFIHKGGQAGFEFELFSLFARSLGLAVEVVIPESGEDPISLLNSGRGDVVAAGLISDERLALYAAFTRPYNFVRKVLILPAEDERPNTLAAVNGLTIFLPPRSGIRAELLELKERLGLKFFIAASRPLTEPEELISQVARGEIPATITDDNLARAALTYLTGARFGVELGAQKPVAWAIRENSPELKDAANLFLKKHFWVTPGGQRRSQTYGILYERYYRDARQIRGFRAVADRPDKSGRISPFDELIHAAADSAGLDWRMVAALIYQESRFDSSAVSSAGARGLMQVLPRFAGPDGDNLDDPETNIRAGVRLLKQIHDGYAYLDSLERWRFSLATYHAGAGHMADARRLAIDAGKDPNRWQGSLEVALPRLMQRRYFDRTRHGFYRGADTVAYVQGILNRYRMYRRLVPSHPGADSWLPATPGEPAAARAKGIPVR